MCAFTDYIYSFTYLLTYEPRDLLLYKRYCERNVMESITNEQWLRSAGTGAVLGDRDRSVSLVPLNTQTVHLSDGKQ